MAFEFVLTDADREKFGGPKWIPFDIAALDDVPFDVLDPIEREVKSTYGFSIGKLIDDELIGGTMRGVRGAIWMALKLAGHDAPALKDFNINTRKARFRAVKPGGDQDPPGETSSGTSSEGEPSTMES